MTKLTLIEQIEKFLPDLLTEGADNSVNGVDLARMLSEKLPNEKESTIRQYLTILSKDPKSLLTKKNNGQGYYLKTIEEIPVENLHSNKLIEYEKVEKIASGREQQVEEKFRIIYKKYCELGESNIRPMIIEHTKGKKATKGLNKWKYPDLVLLQWKDLILSEDNFNMDKSILSMMNGLGEQAFKITSIELKADLRSSNYREYFFQCVSNSKWAHEAHLVVATEIKDSLLEELIRLGNSYGVKISTFGLTFDVINEFPDVSEITEMKQEDFELHISNKFKIKQITQGFEQMELDWEQLSNLRSLNTDFADLLEWIAKSLADSKAYTFENFKEIDKNQKPNFKRFR
ncbi:MAG: hypothetical protein J0L99_03520 [Chitinophagales bacterium]|nr:hypothetical protein [Chitinophagales bacterium]